MSVLGLSTATPLGGVAVVDGAGLLAARHFRAPTSATRVLWPAIEGVLAGAGLDVGDLDGIAVCVGPGTFTGLRVGLAAGMGLSLAAGLPMVGVSSLSALAAGVPYCSWPVRPVVDVRQGQVATARFDTRDGRPVQRGDIESLTPAQVIDLLDGPTVLVGNGVEVYGLQWRDDSDNIRLCPAEVNHLRAEAVAFEGERLLEAGMGGPAESVRPIYARPPNIMVR